MQKFLQRNENSYKLTKKLKMKVTAFLFFMTLFSMQAKEVYAQTKISLKMNKVSVATIIDELELRTEYQFMFDTKVVDLERKVSVSANKKPIMAVLTQLFNNTKTTFKVEGHKVLLFKKVIERKQTQQQRSLSGMVKDEKGNPLPGVDVYITKTKGSAYHRGMKGSTTDFDGHYFIKYTSGAFITFKSMGFQTQSISIDKKKTISVVLKESTNQLDEVLLTGYQKIRKEQSTGSFSQVTAKALDKRISPQGNLLQKLEGLVPGLSWNPGFKYGSGQNKKLLIRGINSLQGNVSPLIVIDGYPTALDITEINPDEVESVTFLKDAAAAAIYGARAANGVIVIQRKRGVAGKTRFTFSNSTSITARQDLSYLNYAPTQSQIDRQLDEFTALDKQYKKWGIGGLTRSFYTFYNYVYSPVYGLKFDLLENKITQTEYDQKLATLSKINNIKEIEKELLREQWNQKYDFSMSGGGENNRYLGTFSYQDNTLSQVGNTSKRLRLGLRSDFKFSKRLSAKIDVNYYNNEDKSTPSINVLSALNNTFTYEKLRDANGKSLAITGATSKETNAKLLSEGLFDETDYYLNRLTDNTSKYISNRYEINTTLTYKLKNWLTLRIGGIYARTQSLNSEFHTKNSFVQRREFNSYAYKNKDSKEITYAVPIGGKLAENIVISKEYTFRPLAIFKYQSKDLKHRISGMAGAELREVGRNNNYDNKYGYDPKTLTHKPMDWKKIRNFKEDIIGRAPFRATFNPKAKNSDKTRFSSLFVNGSYTYDSKYTLSASARLDKSNLFTDNPKLRDVPMWSIGASWNISNEKFFKTSAVDFLKLRVSYGVTGNATNNPSGAYNIGGYQLGILDVPTLYIKSPKNTGIIWEQTKNLNIGIDFGILDHRISGSIDLYNHQSNNLLGNKNINPTLGFQNMIRNYASINNRGIEISLTTVNIKTDNFNWNSTINFSYNKNKVTDIEEPLSLDKYDRIHGESFVKGDAITALYSYQFAGVNPKNGNLLLYNTKGEKDVYFLGDNNPLVEYSGVALAPYNISFLNRISYKNLTFSFLLISKLGNKLRTEIPVSGRRPKNGIERMWSKVRGVTQTDIPNLNDSYTKSEYSSVNTLVRDASYIKLREVSLYYNLRKTALGKLPIDNVKITLQGRNLWLKEFNGEGIDPEAYSVYGGRRLPIAATYSLGVRISF